MNLDSINHYKNKYLKYKKKYLNINGGNKKKIKSKIIHQIKNKILYQVNFN